MNSEFIKNSSEDKKKSVNKSKIQETLQNENIVRAIILIVITGIMGLITRGASLSLRNLRNILLQSSTRGVASIGQTFVILTGGIDVSIGGLGLLCAVIGGSLITTGPQGFFQMPVSIFLGIGGMLLVGILAGLFNGFSVSRIGMPPLIVTLAMWQVLKGTAYQVTKGQTIMNLQREISFVGQGYIAGIPFPVIIFTVAAGIAYFVLYHTPFGRSVYATGGNPASAWLSGINIKNVQLAVYAISGGLAGVAGTISLARTMSASLLTLGGLELDTITAVAIGGVSLAGGRGTLVGVIMGVIIIGVINNGMAVVGLNPAFQDLVKGLIIFIAVALDFIRRSE